jgi:uncharacterized protein YjbI with pentapeptide repeats
MIIKNHEIASAVKGNDEPSYVDLRFDRAEIQEGDDLVFESENFEGTDFSAFNMGFWVFKDCNLRNTRGYSGQPITFERCDLTGADFRDTTTWVSLVDTDFSKTITDETTEVHFE